MANTDYNRLVTGWLAYAASLKRSGFWPRVNDHEAARRARICAGCPAMKPITTACGACVESIKKLRRALFDGQNPQHPSLGVCSLTNEDCQTICHIELPKNHDPKMPPHCWRKP